MMRRALMSATRSPLMSSSSSSSFASLKSSPAMIVVPRRAYPAQDFVDNTRTVGGHLPTVGRAWKIGELRLKSFEDLHTLWFVLLKEKNMLLSERERCRVNRVRLARPDRLVKVRQTMTRILTVLSERKAVQLRLQQYQKEHLLSSPDGPAAAATTAAPAVDAPSSPTSTNV